VLALSHLILALGLVGPLLTPPAPSVTRVSPASGPKNQSVVVTIFGRGLTTCNPGCHKPEVTVGGVPVSVERYEPGFLDITIPPATSGKKDVIILRNDGFVIRFVEGFTVTESATYSAFESILLPIATPAVDGAFGSRWTTEIFARNDGDHDVQLAEEYAGHQALAHPAVGISVRARSTADVSKITDSNRGLSNPGYVMKADRRYVDDLHFSLHSKDLSRSATNAGTEIQVVRESEMRSGTIIFPAIPLDGRFRLALRVYDPSPRDGRQVRVRLFAADASQPLLDRVMTFGIAVRESDGTPRPSHPGYIQYDPREVLASPTIMPLSLRIQLDPVGESFSYWGFVSITNNDTQHVTTVTPQ